MFRNSLHQSNQQLINALTKKLLINSSIEDHINRRLACIIQPQQHYSSIKQTGSNSSSALSSHHANNKLTNRNSRHAAETASG